MDPNDRAAIADALLGITGALIRLSPHLPPAAIGPFNEEVNKALIACGQLIGASLTPPPTGGFASGLFPNGLLSGNNDKT
jgi:hypothetical protein